MGVDNTDEHDDDNNESDSNDDEATRSHQRNERLEQNRISARESRKRKKNLIEELQRTVITLSRENKELMERNEGLRRELMDLGTKNPGVVNIDELMNINSGSSGVTGSSSDGVLLGGGGAVIAPGVVSMPMSSSLASSVVENSQQAGVEQVQQQQQQQLVQPSMVSLPTPLAGFTPQQITMMQQMMALQQVGMLPQMMSLLGIPSPVATAGVGGGGVVGGGGDNTNNNSSKNCNNVGEGEMVGQQQQTNSNQLHI